MSKQFRLFVFAALTALIVLNGVFYFLFRYDTKDSYDIFYFYNLYSVVTFAFLFIAIVKIGGLFSIHAISNFFSFLFLFGRSSLYVFEPNYAFFETDLLVYENIGFSSMLTALIVANIFLYTINAVYVLFGKPDHIKLDINKGTIRTERILFYIIIVFGGLYSVKLFFEFRQILSIGYAAIYAGGLQNVDYHSPIIQYSHVLFAGFFSYYLLVVSSKRKFLLLAGLYLAVSFLDSLKGARVTLILPIFFVLWYYNSLYKINVDYKLVLRGSVVLLVLASFSIYSIFKRNDLEIDIRTNVIKSAIAETGSTLQVVGRYIKNKDQLEAKYPFFLEPVFYPYFYFRHFDILTKGQSEEMLEYRNSFNHQLSAFLNREAYLVGRGVGSSSAAEFYQYGLFLLILFSALYGGMLVIFYSQLNHKIIIFLSTTLVLHIFFIARETPFPNLVGVLKGILLYLVLKFMLSVKWTGGGSSPKNSMV
jgi:oligosaccharide repeat unit polymerase